MTQLVLGTAQFGAQYGAMNLTGRLDDEHVAEICSAAVEAGIHTFDSSPYYGDAQQRLGRLIQPSNRPSFVSKFGFDSHNGLSLETLLGSTIEDLQVDTLAGLLFHRVDDLRDPRAKDAYDLLREARTTGVIQRFGASIYDLNDLEIALELMPDLDLLQLPGNILDRRLLDHPLLAGFHQRGGTVHVRSAYLQGVLLAAPDNVPHRLAGLTPAIQQLHVLAKDSERTLIGLLLGFLKFHPVVDAVVVGALNSSEVRETITAWNTAIEVELSIPPIDEALLDPRNW